MPSHSPCIKGHCHTESKRVRGNVMADVFVLRWSHRRRFVPAAKSVCQDRLSSEKQNVFPQLSLPRKCPFKYASKFLFFWASQFKDEPLSTSLDPVSYGQGGKFSPVPVNFHVCPVSDWRLTSVHLLIGLSCSAIAVSFMSCLVSVFIKVNIVAFIQCSRRPFVAACSIGWF